MGYPGMRRISRRGLIPGIMASRTGRLDALASRNRATARAWCDEFQIPRCPESYEALLADPNIDAVYIPLPNELHGPWVIAAARAGKHVLCEKPLALDAPEARFLIEECRSRGVLLMEAFMWRYQPRTKQLRARVAAGQVGDLRLIRASFSFPISPGDWRLDPARGGGALWDVGCYGVSTARYFAGCEPCAVRARARFGPTGVDMTLIASLEFPTGVLAAIDCSFEQPYRCTYELVGNRGVLEVPDAYLPPQGRDSVARLRIVGSDSDADAGKDSIETLQFAWVDQYAAMVDAFDEQIQAGPLAGPGAEALAQMEVLDAVIQAART